jgi:GNAT superfamily N-acetyltransferase
MVSARLQAHDRIRPRTSCRRRLCAYVKRHRRICQAIKKLTAELAAELGEQIPSLDKFSGIDARVTVVEHNNNGELVGMIWINPNVRPIYLANLFVRPKFRRRKIGTRLMQHAARFAALHATTLAFSITPGSEKFYQALGAARSRSSPHGTKLPGTRCRNGPCSERAIDVAVLR